MIIMYHMINKIKYSCIRPPRLVIFIIASLLLVSCGNKGPLTLPDQNIPEINSEQSSVSDTEY